MRGAPITWLCLTLAAWLACPATLRAQEKETPRDKEKDKDKPAAVLLTVGGEVPQPLRLTAADLARLPRQSVKARDRGGKVSEYEGVPLVEVLKAAGVKFGHDPRGPALANYLLVQAADGYRVVFALSELDPESTDDVTLLADRRDGQPLEEREGPLRIIAPAEKRPARWVRQVRALKVCQPQ